MKYDYTVREFMHKDSYSGTISSYNDTHIKKTESLIVIINPII